MTYRPMVWLDGIVRRLPAGAKLDPDVLPASANLELVNSTTAIIPACCPVCVNGVNQFRSASAAAIATADVVGFTVAAVSPNVSGDIQTSGPLTATAVQWSTISGELNGLTAGAVYWLSVTTGRITKVVPSNAGQFAVRLGRALSPTTLEISIEPPIGL